MISFGSSEVPSLLSREELVHRLAGEHRLNYHLLMPVLLFLHSLCSPTEMITTIMQEFETASEDYVRMNCLVILTCWLRESSAPYDFAAQEDRCLLEDFLDTVCKSKSSAIVAAGKKLQIQLESLVEEYRDLRYCLDIYKTDLKFLLAYPGEECNDTILEELDGIVNESISSFSYLADQNEPQRSASFSTTKSVSMCSECVRDVSEQFPDLDGLGRPRHSTQTSRESDSRQSMQKKERKTDVEIMRDITESNSFLQVYKSPMELSLQLTLLELHCGLLTVRPREFTSLRWTRSRLKHRHPDVGGCSHLYRYIQSTNQRIFWIAREILRHGLMESSYEDCISFFIIVAENSLKLNNFNTAFQVVEALKLPAIKRLRAWDAVSKKKKSAFERLKTLFDAGNNFSNYRQRIAGLGSEARIPCLSIFLKDLSLIEMSSHWLSVEEHSSDAINMQKMKTMFSILSRDIFSVRSSCTSSYFSSRLLCRVHLVESQSRPSEEENMYSRYRRRRSRIDSSDAESLADQLEHSDLTQDAPPLPSPSLEHSQASVRYVGDGFEDTESESDSFVLVCMSMSNGSMEDSYFHSNSSCFGHAHALGDAMAAPESRFLTLTECWSEPLFSLKMKKQIQMQNEQLRLRIYSQMAFDITQKKLRKEKQERRRISLGEEGYRFRLSPIKKKISNSIDYPDPLATIPHTYVVQDAMQSYSQCVSSSVFESYYSPDSDQSSNNSSNSNNNVDDQQTNGLSSWDKSCALLGGMGDLLGRETASNIALTAYDLKIIKLFANISRTTIDAPKLWEWSKVLSRDDKGK